MKKHLFAALFATVAVAGCNNADDAIAKRKEKEESLHHEGFALANARSLCGVTEDRLAKTEDFIESQTNHDKGLQYAVVAGYFEAAADLKAAEAKGEVEDLKASSCPGLLRIIDKMNAEGYGPLHAPAETSKP